MIQKKIRFYNFLILTLFFLVFQNAYAAVTKQDIANLGKNWSQALSSGDPEKIVALYDRQAFLFATFTNQIDTQRERIQYFAKLMLNPELKVHFDTQNIRIFKNAAINSGTYTFSFKNNGKTVSVTARYTFVYAESPRGWLIIDHHSSVMPE